MGRRCQEGAFFLTASLRPVIVELVEECDDEDGLMDKMLPKRNQEFGMEREVGPRFAMDGSFEYEYGMKWKQLYDMKRQKLEALERDEVGGGQADCSDGVRKVRARD